MKDLVKRAKEGDPEAFTALIKQISPDLYKVAISKLDDANDADDAIQETMISAFRNLYQLNHLNSFKHWITKNLKNKCIEINKRKKFNTVPFNESFLNTYLQQTDQEKIESELTFKKLIENLDDTEKIIYYLKIKHQYTFKQIAAELNMNISSVKSIFYRAKDKIKGKV